MDPRSDSPGTSHHADSPRPVCIIGAGPAGLSAAVALKRVGLPFRILDAGRKPGGIWDVERPTTPMYDSAHFISSKTLSGFPGFPMPESYPDYPRHDQIQAYIEDFAAHHDLERHITFGARVTDASPLRGRDGGAETWSVAWETEGEVARASFSGLIVATGVTWHPNVATIEGEFDGEVRHSFTYRSPDEFRGRRVLIVGGGNSGVDIACDAARSADRAFLSLRRGYHFVPKYVFGTPSDVFAHGGPQLPAWLERRVFGFLLNRILVGDLTRYGLPKPDHDILSSHPIMNTQVLHYLGHGDIAAKPDVDRFEGKEVVFTDGTREEIDLVLLATGYRRSFPFLDLPDDGKISIEPGPHEIAPYDLHLLLLHRRHPGLAFMGIFETDGAAYDLFGAQAAVVAETLSIVTGGGGARSRLASIVAESRPDLVGGRQYVDSPRHDYYVADAPYRKAMRRFRKEMAALG